MAEAEDKELKARKEREKDELYALDISGVEWHSAPGTEEHEERVEIAYLPEGAVAMRSSLDPETVLRYTEAEWRAFVLGARDGEFDLEAGSAQWGPGRIDRPLMNGAGNQRSVPCPIGLHGMAPTASHSPHRPPSHFRHRPPSHSRFPRW